MASELQRWHIPGAAIAIIKGEEVWTKGYGYANLQSQTPVTANQTSFRVASISKLFTATAALQLVDKGRLDLQKDIRTYLKNTSLNLRFEKPVTLHHLLTHTAGFDISDVGDAAPTPEGIYDLETLVSHHAMPQVFLPGEVYHYSNFGFALTGYLIQQVSEESFPNYINDHLFKPLDMEYSTFQQPPPDNIQSTLAQAYFWNGNDYEMVPLDYSQVGPADALITTADDMATFLKAHIEQNSLLDKETFQQMHARQYSLSPSPYGMAYGFQENYLYGKRVLEHGGVTLGYSSYLLLLPEEELGIFITQNRREGNLKWGLTRTILTSLLPKPAEEEIKLERYDTSLDDLQKYSGWYRHTGYPHHTFEKAAYILGFRGSEAYVEPAGENSLLINGQRFIATAPHMFTHPEQHHWVKGFALDQDGAVKYHVAGREVLERMAWWEHKRVIQLLLFSSILLGFWCFLIWPVSRMFVARRKTLNELNDVRNKRRILMAVSVLWCVSLIGFFAAMPLMMGGPVQFDYGPSWTLIGILTLLLLASIRIILYPFILVKAWKNNWWHVATRVTLTLQMLGLFSSVGALYYMNLLGYHF